MYYKYMDKIIILSMVQRDSASPASPKDRSMGIRSESVSVKPKASLAHIAIPCLCLMRKETLLIQGEYHKINGDEAPVQPS